MSFHDGAVDQIQTIARFRCQLVENALPDASARPAVEAIVCRSVGTAACPQVPPRYAGAQHVKDRIHDLAVVKALGFSKVIAGGENRVGADGNIEELEALGATVIDLTDVKGDDPSNHDKFVQLATVAPELRAVLGQGIGSKDGAATADELASSLPSTLLGGQVRISTGQ